MAHKKWKFAIAFIKLAELFIIGLAGAQNLVVYARALKLRNDFADRLEQDEFFAAVFGILEFLAFAGFLVFLVFQFLRLHNGTNLGCSYRLNRWVRSQCKFVYVQAIVGGILTFHYTCIPWYMYLIAVMYSNTIRWAMETYTMVVLGFQRICTCGCDNYESDED